MTWSFVLRAETSSSFSLCSLSLSSVTARSFSRVTSGEDGDVGGLEGRQARWEGETEDQSSTLGHGAMVTLTP